MKRAALASAAVLALLAGTGVLGAQETKPIKLGLSAALTGPFNEFGEGLRRGAEVAIDEWNEAGGVLGRKVEFSEVLDDQLVPDRAVQNIRRILDDPEVVALIAPGPSGPTVASLGMVVADGRPMCNAEAQTPTIVHPNGPDAPPYPNVYSVAISLPAEGKRLAKILIENFDNIGLISESTSYGKLGAGYVKQYAIEMKSDATVTSETYNQRAQDMTAQLVRLQSAGAKVIVLVGFGADASVVRKTMTRLNIDLPLYGMSGLATMPFMEGAGELAIGARATQATAFGSRPIPPRVQAFLDRYRKRWGLDRWYGPDVDNPNVTMAGLVAAAYDCVNVLLDGIKRAGSTEAKSIIAALDQTKELPGVMVPSISFTPEKHSAFDPRDLGIYEIKKIGDTMRLEVVEK